MTGNWLLERNGRWLGPYSADELCRMAARRELQPTDRVLHQESRSLLEVRNIPWLSAAAAPGSAPPQPAPGMVPQPVARQPQSGMHPQPIGQPQGNPFAPQPASGMYPQPVGQPQGNPFAPQPASGMYPQPVGQPQGNPFAPQPASGMYPQPIGQPQGNPFAPQPASGMYPQPIGQPQPGSGMFPSPGMVPQPAAGPYPQPTDGLPPLMFHAPAPGMSGPQPQQTGKLPGITSGLFFGVVGGLVGLLILLFIGGGIRQWKSRQSEPAETAAADRPAGERPARVGSGGGSGAGANPSNPADSPVGSTSDGPDPQIEALADDPVGQLSYVDRAVAEGRIEVMIDILPPKRVVQLEQLLRDTLSQANPRLYDRGFALLGRVAAAFRKHEAYFKGSEALRNRFKTARGLPSPSQMQLGLEVLEAFSQSNLRRHADLKNFSMRTLLKETGSKVAAALREGAMAGQNPELGMVADLLRRTEYELVSRDGNQAVILCRRPNVPEEEVEYVLEEGRWVVVGSNQKFAQMMANMRSNAALLARTAPSRSQFESMFADAEARLADIDRAFTQREFDDAVERMFRP